MATDTAKQLLERFRTIRQAWNLQPDATEATAQNKALVALRDWLRTGVDSAEVPLRAVQVLMSDPERPAIHKRPAVNQLFKQISEIWENAGLKEQDVQILRGMLLAAWPRDVTDGGFALASLLDCAWMAIPGRTKKEHYLAEWRNYLLTPQEQATHSSNSVELAPAVKHLAKSRKGIGVDDVKALLAEIVNSRSHYTVELSAPVLKALETHQANIQKLANELNLSNQSIVPLAEGTINLTEQVNDALSDVASREQLDLLWWGQARYSRTLRLPYRRIADSTERLWWMAWECSELAPEGNVASAASFLVETLYQVDGRVDEQQRPLLAWVTEFAQTLRRLHERGQHTAAFALGEPLEEFVREDPLGLPVTWARLEATSTQASEGTLEDRFRDQVGLDPQTLLDRGDWAAWIFREALLDRQYGDE